MVPLAKYYLSFNIEMSSKSILGLNKFNNKEIKVKLCGGREVIGILRGFDAVTNLVLDETVEYMFGRLLILFV